MTPCPVTELARKPLILPRKTVIELVIYNASRDNLDRGSYLDFPIGNGAADVAFPRELETPVSMTRLSASSSRSHSGTYGMKPPTHRHVSVGAGQAGQRW